MYIHGKKDKVVSMIASNHILICLQLQNFLHYYDRLKEAQIHLTLFDSKNQDHKDHALIKSFLYGHECLPIMFTVCK